MDYLPGNSELLVHELKWDGEFSFIAGVDEAGRGCCAGPVCAAAVIFTDRSRIPAGVNDSKQLTHKQRMELREAILAEPSALTSVAMVDQDEIDRTDILRATWLAMRRAVLGLPRPADFVLVDGNPVQGLPVPSENISAPAGRLPWFTVPNLSGNGLASHSFLRPVWLLVCAPQRIGYSEVKREP